jgi:intracellular septation protein A
LGEILLYGLLPLVLFVLVDGLSRRLTVAVGCAVVFAAIEMCAIRYSSGQWDVMSLVSVALFSACGLAAIRFDKRVYFKYQPALFAFIAAGFVGYLQLLDQGLVYRYLPLMEQTAPPSVLAYLEQPKYLELMDRLFDWLFVAIVLDGLLIAYTARRGNDLVWLAANAFGFWIIGGLMLLAYIGYLLIGGTSPI